MPTIFALYWIFKIFNHLKDFCACLKPALPTISQVSVMGQTMQAHT